jgi:hypothetical protein
MTPVDMPSPQILEHPRSTNVHTCNGGRHHHANRSMMHDTQPLTQACPIDPETHATPDENTDFINPADLKKRQSLDPYETKRRENINQTGICHNHVTQM